MKSLTDINNIRVLKGRLEEAIYREQEVNEYKNNPFIEALPRIFTDDDIIDRFYNIPEFEEDYKHQSKNVRFHTLKRIKNYSQVFNIHLILESKLSTMIRRGYLARNPKEADYLKKLGILSDIKSNKSATIEDIDYKMKYMRSTADSLTLLGISGIGKTTAIERLLLMYPQVIKHHTYKNKHFTRTQIVWLKIDCPYDGSLSTLCKSFFKSIDNILGTKYFEKFGYASRITSTMMISMTHLASMYGIGILVIDEIQHLINSKNDPDEMLNFFVTLSNTIGIPTVLIGTPRAQELFKGNFRQARRASSDGFILWDRMDKESKEWDILINILWKMQCLQEYAELTEIMKNAFYDETQGITNELLYSAVSRYNYYVGDSLYIDTNFEVYGVRKPISNLYFGVYLNFLSNSLGGSYTTKEIILNHTIFPFYKPFITEELSNKIINDMKFSNPNFTLNLFSSRICKYEEIKGICIEKAVYKNNQEKAKDERKTKSSTNNDSLFKLLKLHKRSVDTLINSTVIFSFPSARAFS